MAVDPTRRPARPVTFTELCSLMGRFPVQEGDDHHRDLAIRSAIYLLECFPCLVDEPVGLSFAVPSSTSNENKRKQIRLLNTAGDRDERSRGWGTFLNEYPWFNYFAANTPRLETDPEGCCPQLVQDPSAPIFRLVWTAPQVSARRKTRNRSVAAAERRTLPPVSPPRQIHPDLKIAGKLVEARTSFALRTPRGLSQGFSLTDEILKSYPDCAYAIALRYIGASCMQNYGYSIHNAPTMLQASYRLTCLETTPAADIDVVRVARAVAAVDAGRDFRKAECLLRETPPDSQDRPAVVHWGCEFSLIQGKFNEAIECISRSVLNGESQLKLLRAKYAHALTIAGRLEDALDVISNAEKLGETIALTHIVQARICAELARRARVDGDKAEALRQIEMGCQALDTARTQDHEEDLPDLQATTYWLCERICLLAHGVDIHPGHAAEVAGTFVEVICRRVAGAIFPSYFLALMYAQVGEYDEAMTMLETCEQTHCPRVIYIAVDPRLATLRARPEYRERLACLDNRIFALAADDRVRPDYCTV